MKILFVSIRLCILVLGIAALATGQTVINGSRVMMGSWDASGATHTLPAKTGPTAQLPAACTPGEEYFATDSTAGQNKYYCTAANTWTQQTAYLRVSPFANLGAPVNGGIQYCSNCVQATPCTAGGAGALATAISGAWSCGGGSGGATYTFRDNLANTSNTIDFNPFDTGMFLYDEFMPTNRANSENFSIGQLNWGLYGVGGGATTAIGNWIADPGGHPGIFRITGDTVTAGHGASLTLADVYDVNAGTMSLANLGSGGSFTYWETQSIIETDPANIASTKYVVGFTDNTSTYHPSNGNQIAVRYDTAGGGCSSGESTADWVYEVIVAGAQFCLDSGVAVTPATWYKIRIFSSTPGTVNFQIGVAAGAFGTTASITHAPTATLTPNFMSVNVGTGVAHYLYIDRWAIRIRGINR